MAKKGKQNGVYRMVQTPCSECGVIINHFPAIKRKHCSRVCFFLYKTTLTGSLSPRWNGGPKPKPPAKPRAKYWLGKKRPDISARFKGDGHPNWKGGYYDKEETAIRHSVEYKTWRKHVFNRDDYTCQACGVRGGTLNADHELPFALYPDLRFEILNGRTLCEPCHKLTPTFGGNVSRKTLMTV